MLSTAQKSSGVRIHTSELSKREARIVEAYRKKYRQSRGAALLMAAIPVMEADLKKEPQHEPLVQTPVENAD